MVTKEMFIEKLSEWLTNETCDALAFEAEHRFAGNDNISVYEFMLILMAGYDAAEFADMCDDCGIELNADDDIDGMYADMVNEW